MTEEFETSLESDHDLILLLKKENQEQNTKVDILEQKLMETQESHHETSEQLTFHEKLSAQQTLLKHVFYGVISIILCMWVLVFVGWCTKQTSIEREMAFFERIILVLIGIVGGAVSSFFDVRNFTLNGKSNGNGNGNGKKPEDLG